LVEVTADSATVSMAASEWFCQRVREVSSGIVGMLGNLAIRRAIAAASDAEERFVILEASATLLAPVLPDGGTLTARGVVRQRRGDILVPEAQITDADGRTVAMVHGACLLRKRQRQPRPRPGERVLLTVLFTDLVGSTDRARELGDARWRDLLEEHNAVVRRQIELDRGREVKTTGDGFLITFDSPSRAVQCARAIRQRLLDLDLEVRAGIHTGECELGGGDVSGLAVHVAARVQSAAAPGEILVSSTVRDLLGASDVALAERGVHTLKGLEGTWVLLAVTE